jgi:hypothetical protein
MIERMIDSNSLGLGVFSGVVLIVVGLVPGLFQSLVNGAFSIASSLSDFSYESSTENEIRQPIWLAGAGVTVILLTVLAYL